MLITAADKTALVIDLRINFNNEEVLHLFLKLRLHCLSITFSGIFEVAFNVLVNIIHKTLYF